MSIVKATIAEQIYDALKEKIRNLEIKPGERIVIDDLAAQFGTSETPIKEALLKLTENGLVVSVSRKGFYVVEITPKDVEEIYQLRKMFEIFGIKYGNFDKADFEQLKKRMESLLVEEDQKKKQAIFTQTEKDLHSKLVLMSDNKRLRDLYFQICVFADILFHVANKIDRYTKEHIEIVDAIMENDCNKACLLLEAHMDNGRDEIKQALDELMENVRHK